MKFSVRLGHHKVAKLDLCMYTDWVGSSPCEGIRTGMMVGSLVSDSNKLS